MRVKVNWIYTKFILVYTLARILDPELVKGSSLDRGWPSLRTSSVRDTLHSRAEVSSRITAIPITLSIKRHFRSSFAFVLRATRSRNRLIIWKGAGELEQRGFQGTGNSLSAVTLLGIDFPFPSRTAARRRRAL